jgi:hypothetical protein
MYFATFLKTTAPVKLPISQLSLSQLPAIKKKFRFASKS